MQQHACASFSCPGNVLSRFLFHPPQSFLRTTLIYVAILNIYEDNRPPFGHYYARKSLTTLDFVASYTF
jgi:hypothetical protein